MYHVYDMHAINGGFSDKIYAMQHCMDYLVFHYIEKKKNSLQLGIH